MVLPIIKIEISANIIAWYGAILATGSLSIAILNYLRDRRVVKIKISDGWLIPNPWGGEDKKIFIEAQNHGKRPVTLISTGFILSNGSSIVLPVPKNIQFPYKLNEGESVSTFFEKADILKNLKEGVSVSQGFYVDSIGNKYKTKFDKKYLNDEN